MLEISSPEKFNVIFSGLHAMPLKNKTRQTKNITITSECLKVGRVVAMTLTVE